MNNNQDNNIRPENSDDILVPDEIKFVRPIRLNSKIMKVLKENFDIEPTIIVREKKVEENE